MEPHTTTTFINFPKKEIAIKLQEFLIKNINLEDIIDNNTHNLMIILKCIKERFIDTIINNKIGGKSKTYRDIIIKYPITIKRGPVKLISNNDDFYDYIHSKIVKENEHIEINKILKILKEKKMHIENALNIEESNKELVLKNLKINEQIEQYQNTIEDLQKDISRYLNKIEIIKKQKEKDEKDLKKEHNKKLKSEKNKYSTLEEKYSKLEEKYSKLEDKYSKLEDLFYKSQELFLKTENKLEKMNDLNIKKNK